MNTFLASRRFIRPWSASLAVSSLLLVAASLLSPVGCTRGSTADPSADADESAAKSGAPTSKDTSAAEDDIARQDLLTGYKLLENALSDEADLDWLKLFKKATIDSPNDVVNNMMEQLSDAAEKDGERLAELRKLEPAVTSSPEESEIGDAIRSISKEKGSDEMMSREGVFDVRFMLLQAQATRMVSAISRALLRFEANAKRKDWLEDVAIRYERYRDEIVEYLAKRKASRS